MSDFGFNPSESQDPERIAGALYTINNGPAATFVHRIASREMIVWQQISGLLP
jgi:hypothetical protein